MSAWSRLVDWMDTPESGTSLALVRILTGGVVLRTIGAVWWSGVTQAIWYDAAHGGIRDLGRGNFLMKMLGGPTPERVDGMMALTMLLGLGVLLGMGGPIASRVIAFATMQCFMSLADLNGHAGGSYDELITNLLWLLVLAGPTKTLSLESLRTTGSWTSGRSLARWTRLLVVFQAIVMYATTGWQKVSAHWVPGGDLSALYYILQQPTWQHFDHSWVAWVYPLTQVGTIVSWLWEVTAPLWLLAFVVSLGQGGGRIGRWLRLLHVREGYLVVGMIFHVGVAAMMNIGPFTWASLCLYPAFIHPWEWERAWGRLARSTEPPTAT